MVVRGPELLAPRVSSQHHFSKSITSETVEQQHSLSLSLSLYLFEELREDHRKDSGDIDELCRMCGVDVDLDDGGTGEEEKEEEFWVGEGVKMLPPPVAHSGGSAWGSRRGRCGCVACGAALILWDLCVVLVSALLLAVVFSVVLLPAMLLLYAGFLCHSRVLDAPSAICRYLDDNSCSALIILGFVMMSPLVVVAAAIFCGLLRRFRLLLLIQPITRAWYRGRLLDWTGSLHAWV